MNHRTTAVYESGMLKPLHPLPLSDGDRVEVILVAPSPLDPNSPEATFRRQRAIEMLQARMATAAPPDADDDYDILEALNANRLSEGARPLLPPETGEKAW